MNMFDAEKTRMIGLPYGEKNMRIPISILRVRVTKVTNSL